MIIEVRPVEMPDGSMNDGLIKHYSDKKVFMLQVETGAKYGEAIDIYPCPYTYTETDEPMEDDVIHEIPEDLDKVIKEN